MIYMLFRTMLGWDQCSPSSNHDSQGEECSDACHQMEVEGKVVMMMMMKIMMMIMKIEIVDPLQVQWGRGSCGLWILGGR